MKKFLLIALCSSQFMVAQTLLTEDFSLFTVGNIGTDITGQTATNNIFTLATNGTAPTTATNAGNDNFQIVTNDALHGNVLQITGTNGDKGSRAMWYDGFVDAWEFRDPGNEIIEIEFELYTGNTAGTSVNTKGLFIYDATRTKVLAGYSFNTKTLVLSGVAYFTAATAPIGNYLFFLNTGGTNLVLPAETWVKLGVSYNKTTGVVRWRGPSHNGQVTGASAGTDPDRASIISTSGTTTTGTIVTNTAAAIGLFDNFEIRAAATDSLLGIAETVTVDNNNYSVYPNPATSIITVSSKLSSGITAITLTDVNGRIVKTQNFDSISDVEMNISDVASGMYLMNINSKEGSSTVKFIKN